MRTRLFSHLSRLKKHVLSVPAWVMPLVVGITVAVGSFFRLANISYPVKQVFDEVYFPVFAAKYLSMQEVYDVHPPLGKFVISVGIWLFGDSSFGWRVMPALLGIVLILVIGLVVWHASKSVLAASIALVLASLDGFLIVYSRTSLMDGILVLSILLVILAAQTAKGRAAPYIIGIALGAALAIKWPAVAVALCIPFIVQQKERVAGYWAKMVAAAILLYSSVVVFGQMVGGSPSARSNPLFAALEWHYQAARYHSSITDTHPWGSPWWSWPLGQRPVLFLYDQVPGGYQVVNTVGNPILSWVICITVLAVLAMALATILPALWRRSGVVSLLKSTVRHPLTPWLVAFFAFWLPWALVSRVLFHYHYLPSYVFGMMIVSYALAWLWHHKQQYLAVVVFLLLVLGGVLFMPFAVSWLTQSPETLRALTWIPSWLSASWR
jgi:dolichyl-phosphate-mannose--protein O-mannosyl transferase